MATFFTWLAVLTWAGGGIAALSCMSTSKILGFIILFYAVIQGALLMALSMLLTNTEETKAECSALRSEVKRVQDSLNQLTKQLSVISEGSNANTGKPAPQAAVKPAPTKFGDPNKTPHVVPDKNGNTYICPKCGKVQKSDRANCYNCGAVFIDD